MSGVREPLTVQHSSHVRRESSQGSRKFDRARATGNDAARDCADVPIASPNPKKGDGLVNPSSVVALRDNGTDEVEC